MDLATWSDLALLLCTMLATGMGLAALLCELCLRRRARMPRRGVSFSRVVVVHKGSPSGNSEDSSDTDCVTLALLPQERAEEKEEELSE
ncbi:MC024L [Molluscum contagiosum virus subtype 1]|uniref:MC024L n=2 Tax=Molluscum contagiosum virus TaxID=10279 RepID=Q98192_MCV1|nr:MC024L [Molluscum contagiosum virus subtype 1]AZT86339.1 MC024L [Molluscum contagiosum virus]AAC55152.1 MC024L [Molluscum contagiosum virus subtype 1]AQY16768.1 MC024 [Molluscum contagiosum virus subtype 1]AQY17127.1 MC024 [Molluscum contagiosum virus subtype 1]AYO88691.1 MC024 [Molluscum contagiosum virus subtype 1]